MAFQKSQRHTPTQTKVEYPSRVWNILRLLLSPNNPARVFFKQNFVKISKISYSLSFVNVWSFSVKMTPCKRLTYKHLPGIPVQFWLCQSKLNTDMEVPAYKERKQYQSVIIGSGLDMWLWPGRVRRPQRRIFQEAMTLCKLHRGQDLTHNRHKGLSFINPRLYVSCVLGKTWHKTKQRLSFGRPACMTLCKLCPLQDMVQNYPQRSVFQRAIMMHDSIKLCPGKNMAQRVVFHKCMPLCKLCPG